MADSLTPRERALRALPPSYSLALRLRDAHVDADVICGYIDMDRKSFDLFCQIADAKLRTALAAPRDPSTHASMFSMHGPIAGFDRG